MRALDDRELDSVSGGCFGLLSNLFGGLFGGGQAQAAAAPASAVAGAQAPAQAAGSPAAAASPLQAGISNFLQNPIGGVVSLVSTGIQDAVNFVTRLI